ncbi:hypothetical protein [Streptomyces spectabilis]|uniref:Uncharacterized protein n=1 Tax=Streptomyces spectabilis TaxID=68270 RepID=A0A5P2X7Z8_STRST|nr:hypothetical protein [Streptomyces spectabilis]MBB5108273.1 hypothetical protein [Streptomyces spectabilis]MCI3901033.1 hypothetical protein [Streptomyces spectabilis]QEV58532.1 hypothetical protein CP982_07260 [Streptomyces spectabilis]GGV45569.1 hypothetical protein GCM10010245_71340 [Streptomyces spectabilis]
MSSSFSSARDLADAVVHSAQRVGATTPAIRGADWRLATVTAAPGDGTVTADGVTCRCLDSYPLPTVGDLIVITQSSAGNWLAAGRTSNSNFGIGQSRIALKTADTSRTNTATPTDDPHLVFTVAANATYAMDGWIKYSALVDLDITIDWTVPASALGEWTGHGMGLGTTGQSTSGYSIRTETNDVAQPRNFSGTTSAAGEYSVLLAGTLRVQGTGGTYALQWSQGNTGGTATTVYTDSWLRLTRIS